MVGGQRDSGGRAAPSAASIRGRRASSHWRPPASVGGCSAARSPLSASPVAAGERRLLGTAIGIHDEIAARVLEEPLDLALRLLQLGVAQAREPHSLLVEEERLLERKVALLELLHDLVQLLEGRLEGGGLLRGHTSSFPVTRAASAPVCTRIRTGSPPDTSAASPTRRPHPSTPTPHPRPTTPSA